MLSDSETLSRLKTANYCLKKAALDEDPHAAVRMFIEELASGAGADGVYVCLSSGGGAYTLAYFWENCPQAACKARESFFAQALPAPWLEKLRSGAIAALRAPWQDSDAVAARLSLQEAQLRSLLLCPILFEGRLRGYAAFANPGAPGLEKAGALWDSDAGTLCTMLRFRKDSDAFSATRRDSLTGLLGMRAFGDLTEPLIEAVKAGTAEHGWAVVFFDLPNFKVFNREHGNYEGDRLLRRVAEILREELGSELLSRFEADHFYALTDAANAQSLVRRVHDRMQRGEAAPGIRAGIYILDGSEENAMLAADRAMLSGDQAKGDYDRYFRVYAPEMEARLRREAYLIEHVDEAVKNGWIKVYLQPIVSTLSGHIYALEALSRWVDPVYGFLNPGEFIEALDKNRLLYKLDLYVIRKACEILRAESDAGRSCAAISVNLSRHDLELPDLHERINAILQEYLIPHDSIFIEITETALTDHEAAISEHIERFHQDGYAVWLDDFGSGYSSLNTIQNFNFDLVKIDMLFLRHENERTPFLLRSIVDLAKKLGMVTLTEGVETQEQFENLREIGCSLVQGFLFSKPDSPESLRKNAELNNLKIADPADRIFFRRVGGVNVLDAENPLGNEGKKETLPCAIIELDSHERRFIYASNTLKDFLEREFGYEFDEDRLLNQLSEGSYYSVLSSLAEKSHRTGAAEHFDFVMPDITGRAEVTFITQYRGRRAYYLCLKDLTPYRKSTAAKIRSLQYVYTLFEELDELFLNNPGHERFEHIYGEISDPELSRDSLSPELTIRKFAEAYVHPSERERYLKFMDLSSLRERLNASPRHALNAFFHMKRLNGTYEWQRVLIAQKTLNGMEHCLYAVSRNPVGWTPDRLNLL
ncbi:MAG: sensor domain-containing phosphodiesterase [Succinivibrio sp.]|nr:sensor domain-containing phosphodiesterase [Succinivibrio sp.]